MIVQHIQCVIVAHLRKEVPLGSTSRHVVGIWVGKFFLLGPVSAWTPSPPALPPSVRARTTMASGPATLPAGLGSFEVNVKDFHGHSVVISVNPRWNVAAVKQRISESTGVPPEDYNLVFAGTPLADSLTLMVGGECTRASVPACRPGGGRGGALPVCGVGLYNVLCTFRLVAILAPLLVEGASRS